jgi:hypothetical protein
MHSVKDLLAFTLDEWRAFKDDQLIEWAKQHFDVCRPSEKQVNRSTVITKLKKAGLNPAMFKATDLIKREPEPSKVEIDLSKLTPEKRLAIEPLMKLMDKESFGKLYEKALE